MGLLFKKRNPTVKVIVDYEYWYFAYKRLFGITPDLEKWICDIRKQYRIAEATAFANFSDVELASQKDRIAQLGIEAIDTGSADNAPHRSETTQFAVLDHIYQSSAKWFCPKDYVLFVGDANYCAAVKYLTTERKKRIHCCGVEMRFDQTLQEASTTASIYPELPEYYPQYFDWIISNLAYCVDKNKHPSFTSTIDAIVRRHGVQSSPVRHVLKKMIDEGYVRQREHHFRFGQKARVIYADWDRLIKEGLFDPEKT